MVWSMLVAAAAGGGNAMVFGAGHYNLNATGSTITNRMALNKHTVALAAYDVDLSVPIALTFSKFNVYLHQNSLSDIVTLKFQHDAADGNQVVTFSSGVAGIGQDTSNEDSLDIGDTASYLITTDSSSGSCSHVSLACKIE